MKRSIIFSFPYLLACLSIVSFLAASCANENQTHVMQNQTGQTETSADNTADDANKILVKEVLQTSQYTYLRAIENEEEVWLAVARTEAEEGSTYYYSDGLHMTDFESKDLDRTFPNIIFTQTISTEPLAREPKASPHSSVTSALTQEIDLTQDADGISIAELMENKTNYAGKTIKIKGIVSKYNEDIMKTNWIHLQDGTLYKGAYDLTLTSDMKVAVGDTVTMQGVVALDKDFGYGYMYPVIVEKAEVVN